MKDKLKTLQDTRNCNRWFLLTEDDFYVGEVNHICGEAFAKGIVESWNASRTL